MLTNLNIHSWLACPFPFGIGAVNQSSWLAHYCESLRQASNGRCSPWNLLHSHHQLYRYPTSRKVCLEPSIVLQKVQHFAWQKKHLMYLLFCLDKEFERVMFYPNADLGAFQVITETASNSAIETWILYILTGIIDYTRANPSLPLGTR